MRVFPFGLQPTMYTHTEALYSIDRGDHCAIGNLPHRGIVFPAFHDTASIPDCRTMDRRGS